MRNTLAESCSGVSAGFKFIEISTNLPSSNKKAAFLLNVNMIGPDTPK